MKPSLTGPSPFIERRNSISCCFLRLLSSIMYLEKTYSIPGGQAAKNKQSQVLAVGTVRKNRQTAQKARIRSESQRRSDPCACVRILLCFDIASRRHATACTAAATFSSPNWVAVKELNLKYYIGETLLFTIYTHYGNLI